jgi:transposase
MFIYFSRRSHHGQLYEYVQICESYRAEGQPRRRVLCTLGRRDQLSAKSIDSLVRGLRKLASPQEQTSFSDAEAWPSLAYGPVLVARAIWEELGLAKLIRQGRRGFSVEQAIFRLVTNRLVDPRSKLSTVEWQERVAWPQSGSFGYEDFLRAMDALNEQRERLEEQIFFRVRDMFSLPLRLVFYDLTSSYFEGDGVCPLAEFGHSRDHRPDRRQVVLGLAVTREGLPISHRLFAGNTADVKTLPGVARELKERFGFQDVVVVGDGGLLSEENVGVLEGLGLRYVLRMWVHKSQQARQALAEAESRGLPRPRDPDAPWQVLETNPQAGRRYVVVYSAFRALHDREVRLGRLSKAREDLGKLQAQVQVGKLKSERAITVRATRILKEYKVSRLVRWDLAQGRFRFWVPLDVYRERRRQDGIFVLTTNDPELATDDVVDTYRQLHEVEDAFRVIKSLLKLRPIFHRADRRVQVHVFICVLAYLIATVLKQRLAKAGLPMTAARALDALASVQVTRDLCGDYLVRRVTKPEPEAERILRALGLPHEPRLLSTDRIQQPA